jgi:hypothetical protein
MPIRKTPSPRQPGETRSSARPATSLRQRLAALERLVSEQAEQLASQHAMIVAQNQRLAALGAEPHVPVSPAPAGAAHDRDVPGRRSRRTVLKLGGMAAAASAAALAGAASELARPSVAHASGGVPWQTGGPVNADVLTQVLPISTYSDPSTLDIRITANSGAAPAHPLTGANKAAIAAYDTTVVGAKALYGDSINGTGVTGIGDNAFGVQGISAGGTGVNGVSNTGTGVVGASSSGAGGSFMSTSGTGVVGNSNSGSGGSFTSTSTGTGVVGTSSSGLGASFTGGLAPLKLAPGGSLGAPGSGSHTKGEIYLDSAAAVWVCIDNGTPGSWVRLGAVAPGALGGIISYLSTPVRLLDARNGASSGLANRGPLGGNEVYAFAVAGLGGSGIPSNAQGLIANVTVLGPSAVGNLSLFPAGGAIPTVASMTFGSPGLFLANGVNVAIGTGGGINIQNQSSGTTPLVLDAVAYVS